MRKSPVIWAIQWKYSHFLENSKIIGLTDFASSIARGILALSYKCITR